MSDLIKVIDESVRPYVLLHVDYLSLPDQELKVYLVLKSFAYNNKDNCFPSIATIAERAGKESRRTSDIIKSLVIKGLVKTESRSGFSNVYILTGNKIAEESQDVSDDPCNKLHTPPAINCIPTPAINCTLSNKNINNKKEVISSCPSDDGLNTDEECFNRFWECYPRKEAKRDAMKAWKKIKQKDYEQIISDIALRQNHNWKGKAKQYIPLPASYLNGQRWNDELTQGESNNAVQQSTKTNRGYNMQDRLEQRTRDYLESLQREQQQGC